MPVSHNDITKLVDINGNQIQRGFYLSQDGLLIFASNTHSNLVELEQELNFYFLDDLDFRDLTPLPASYLEEVAQQYEINRHTYKANWLRRYLETTKNVK